MCLIGSEFRAFLNIQTGGKCPPVLHFAPPPVKRFLTPEKYPFLYRFSAMLSNNYCCHHIAMNGTLRVLSSKERTAITFLHNNRKLYNTRTVRYYNNYKTRDFISNLFLHQNLTFMNIVSIYYMYQPYFKLGFLSYYHVPFESLPPPQ